MPVKPSMFNLPEKYTDFRTGQFELAAKIASYEKYAFLLDAPPGVGKSLIGATIQRLTEKQVIYVATTKQLQDQLIADFPYAKTLKGRSNYPCLKFPKMYPNISAEECSKTLTNPCEFDDRCPYTLAKRAALAAPIAVLNTSYFLAEANNVGTFSGAECLILDEFDTVEGVLMSYIEVLLTQKMIDKHQLATPKYKTKFEAWVEWAAETLKILQPRYNSLKQHLESEWSLTDFALIREEKELGRLVKKLAFFIREVDKTWVWYPGEDRWSFKPVWIAKYAQATLWDHAKRIVGMSATILDYQQMCRNVGLDMKTTGYIALQSPFPKEHRPIHYNPVANVTREHMAEALPALKKRITEIMKENPDAKILVHTNTYEITRYLKDNLDHNRVLTHTSFDRADVLERFKLSPSPLVLLSPSMDRGVDLPGDQCRVVIIAKVPYPYLGDPQINKRVHASTDGQQWYNLQAVSKIIQMAGRGVRSEDDWAVTYILDAQFEKIYNNASKIFPAWFKQAVIYDD